MVIMKYSICFCKYDKYATCRFDNDTITVIGFRSFRHAVKDYEYLFKMGCNCCISDIHGGYTIMDFIRDFEVGLK